MEELQTCPVCHQPTSSTAYFCPNCGHNFHPIPLSTSTSSQLFLYIKCLLLPPLGIIWGIRYLRQPDRASKVVGWAAIAITTIVLLISIKVTVDLVNSVNEQVNKQLQDIGGL